MKYFNIYFSLIVTLLLTSCGDEKSKTNFTLNSDKDIYQLGETIQITPNPLSGKAIESISYTFQEKEVNATNNNLSIKLDKHLLGAHTVYASIKSGDITENITKEVTILNNKAPKVYSYEIIKTYPHNEAHYTQGLEFVGDSLYESAGKRKESKLLLKDLNTGKTLKEHPLENNYFAEGLTIVDNKIHQLTWQANIGFTYDLASFQK